MGSETYLYRVWYAKWTPFWDRAKHVTRKGCIPLREYQVPSRITSEICKDPNATKTRWTCNGTFRSSKSDRQPTQEQFLGQSSGGEAKRFPAGPSMYVSAYDNRRADIDELLTLNYLHQYPAIAGSIQAGFQYRSRALQSTYI